MPYARKPYKKSYRKRSNRRYQSTAQKALRIAKKAYKLPELKYTYESGNATITATGQIINISDTAQGVTNNQRIGDTIKPTSTKIRFQHLFNASGIIRAIVFRWVSGSTSSVTDVLQAANVYSFKSEDKRFQSEILFDRTYAADSDNLSIVRNINVKLSKPISTPEGATAQNRNGIYLLLIANQTQPTNGFNYQARTYFRDQ